MNAAIGSAPAKVCIDVVTNDRLSMQYESPNPNVYRGRLTIRASDKD